MKPKFLLLLVTIALLVSCGAAWADEEGQDYGYWCTECGRQHGPGETCPQSSAPAYSEPEQPYNFQEEQVYPTASTSTTLDTSTTTTTTLMQKEGLKSRMQTAHKKIQNVHPFGTSVVDLRDKKGSPVVDPTAKPRSLKIQPPPAPNDKEMWDLIAEMQLSGKQAGLEAAKKRLFEKNPDKFLTNPLWTKEKIAIDTMRAMDSDDQYIAARKRLVKEADKAIYQAQIQLLFEATADLDALREKNGLKDFAEFDKKWRSVPAFRKGSNAIWADYQDKLFEVTIKSNERLHLQMDAETKKFYQRHPELKKTN